MLWLPPRLRLRDEAEADRHGLQLPLRQRRGGGERARVVCREGCTAHLEEGCDPVPCPKCGIFQPNMVPQVKAQYLAVLRTRPACASWQLRVSHFAPSFFCPRTGVDDACVGLLDRHRSERIRGGISVGGTIRMPKMIPNGGRRSDRERVAAAERSSAAYRCAAEERTANEVGDWVMVAVGLGFEGKDGVVLVQQRRPFRG